MKILLCAFACSPQWGSEPGVGWRWAHELARNHEVVVLTHERFREHIEADTAARPASLSFAYCDAPWRGGWRDQLLNRAEYYAWWLLCSTRTAARLQRLHRFDLIHHLTLGTFRYPSLHGLLGVPFVIGPVGGAERAPYVLRRSMPRNDRVHDVLRDILIFTARFDPSLWLTFASARLIVCKTNDTLKALPRWAQRKAIQHLEIGTPPIRKPAVRESADGPLRVLCVGRLIGLKGMHLALRCLDRLHRSGLAVTLEVIGKGPQLGALRAQAEALGLADRVEFIDFMPQADLIDHYRRADVFLFPSLHDSSGGVIYEALACGLPVVCLDLGGPKHAVTPACSIVVPTEGLDEDGVVSGLTRAVERLAHDPAARARMSAEALAHAERCTWQHTVSEVYAEIEARLPEACPQRRATARVTVSAAVSRPLAAPRSRRRFVRTAAFAVGLAVALAGTVQAKLLRVAPQPANALARAVAQLEPGDVLELGPGEYRASIDLRDAPGLRGRGGVTIRAGAGPVTVKGSDIVGGWTQTGPARYEKLGWPVEPQQVFVGGRPLQQIGGQVFGGYPDRPGHELLALHRKDGGIWPGRRGRSERDLAPDSFYFDAPRRRLVLQLATAVRPEQLVAEVSVRSYLLFSEGVAGVRLAGIGFSHSNTTLESRSGAVTILGHDAVVEDISVRDCDGVGLAIAGDRAVVARNRLERCGRLGMNLRGIGHRVLDNDLVGNNTRGFNKWWEAGGAKFVGEGGLRLSLVQGNRALANHGDGLWFDWGNDDNVVERNLAAFNEGFGLHYEASGPARIAHNVVVANRQRGLYALHSRALTIERNLVALNGMEGLAVVDEGLRDSQLDLEANDNRVRDNIVAYHDAPALVLPAGGRGNVSNGNLYVHRAADAASFARGWPSWMRPALRGLPAWQARTGQDAGSLAFALPVPATLLAAVRRRQLGNEWQALVVAAREEAGRAGLDARTIGPDLQAWPAAPGPPAR